MGKNALFIAILVLFDGAAVAWAAWQFWTLRPGKAEASSAFTRAKPQSASPEASGHPEGEHGADHG
jgi:hypothetical protein